MKKWMPILLLICLTSSAFAVKAWVRNTFRGYQDGVYEPETLNHNGKTSYKLPGADWYVRWIVEYPVSDLNSWCIVSSEGEILYFVISDADDPPSGGWTTAQSDPHTATTPSGLEVLEAISGNGAYTQEAEFVNGFPSYRKNDDSRWLVQFIDSEWRIFRPGFPVAYSIFPSSPPLNSGWTEVSAIPTVDIVPDDFQLPVSLITFNAELKQGCVLLTWQTQNESNNLGFILEKRSTKSSWQWLADYHSHAALQGKDFSTDTTSYKFIDDRVKAGLAHYRLWQQDIDGHRTFIGELSTMIPADYIPQEFALLPAFPNPFNMETTCTIELPHKESIMLDVVSMTGQVIKKLYQGELDAGIHHIRWNGHNSRNIPVPSGVYLFVLQSTSRRLVGKVSLIK